MWRLDELASLVHGKVTGPSDRVIQGAGSVSRAETSHITLVTSPDIPAEFRKKSIAICSCEYAVP